MKATISLIITSLLLSFHIPQLNFSAHAADKVLHIQIAIEKLQLERFNKIANIDSCDKFDNYKHKDISRAVVELLLICKAMKASEIDYKFEFVIVPNYARGLKHVETGYAHIFYQTIWNIEINKELVNSTIPIIKDGWFEKGIFVSDSSRIKSINSKEELMKHTALMVPTWNVDWNTLKELMPKGHLQPARNYLTIFKMLDLKRADFTIMELHPTKQMSEEGIKLVMLEGVKIKLNGSRSFVVSKSAPNSEKIYKTFQKGFAKLHERGEIENALRKSGFLNDSYKNWKTLNK